jgi:hypothetical protein
MLKVFSEQIGPDTAFKELNQTCEGGTPQLRSQAALEIVIEFDSVALNSDMPIPVEILGAACPITGKKSVSKMSRNQKLSEGLRSFVCVHLSFQCIRSRVEGDKRIVPENHGEWQEGQLLAERTRKRPRGYSSTGFSLSGGQHYGKQDTLSP